MGEKITTGILKWPSIIAAIVVVLRVVLERAGAPSTVTNLASVVVLCVLIGPLYFAYRLAKSDTPRPYLALIKLVLAYAIIVRAMVIPTYWLAYIYQWPDARFAAANGGVVGEGVTPLTAYLGVPFLLLVFWSIASVVVGGALGSILIKLMRKPYSSVTQP